MPKNSFRLFAVSLHDGRIRAVQPFDAAKPRAIVVKNNDGTAGTKKFDPINYLDVITHAVESRGAAPFAFGKKVAEDNEEAATVVGHVIRWEPLKPPKNLGNAVRFWFEAGPTSDDGVVVDPSGGTDIDLNGKATLHHYRASLIVGPGCNYGILAVEVRGRSCPRDQLVRALKETTDQPWRLKIRNGVANKAAVLQFIENATIRSVTFTEFAYDVAGNKKAPQRKQLRIDELSGKALDWKKVRAKVTGWFDGSGTNNSKDAATDLKALVVTDEVGIPFDDVAVQLEDGEARRTFRPSSDYSNFSYDLGPKIVADETFFEQCESAAKGLLLDIQPIAEHSSDDEDDDEDADD